MKNKILYAIIAILLIALIYVIFSKKDNSSPLFSSSEKATPVCGSSFYLPKDYQLLAASVYAGSSSGSVAAEYSGYKKMDVMVNVTKPTVLILTGYEKNVWNVISNQPDLIKGILLAGYYDQKAIANNTKAQIVGGEQSACKGSYYDEQEVNELNQYSKTNLNKTVDALFLRQSSQVLTIDDQEIQPLKDKLKQQLATQKLGFVPAAPDSEYVTLPDGNAGMQKALEMGLIRPATVADAQQFDLAAMNVSKDQNLQHDTVIVGSSNDDGLRHQFYQHRSYVILKPFRFPAEMYGAHSATFYIAQGVAYPKGELSHSELYNINDGTCRGSGCGRH